MYNQVIFSFEAREGSPRPGKSCRSVSSNTPRDPVSLLPLAITVEYPGVIPMEIWDLSRGDLSHRSSASLITYCVYLEKSPFCLHLC
jgi:hypothetical protein